MGDKDWKAKVKELRKKLAKLKKRAAAAAEQAAANVAPAVQAATETVAARVKAPNPVSPLAPAAFPDLPVIDGVDFAAAAA
ncbi:MAG: bifunctional ornithine acetyltransferase/N-acetylglutamate synthase, partial [Gemmobacter sp.]